jgi:tRNA A-37 threonylcarbamoyl transferase component Bud32
MRPINLNNESFDEQIFDAELSTLEPPDHGRGGTSSVARVICTTSDGSTVNAYLKRQHNYAFRDWRSGLLKRPTVLREQRCIRQLQRLGIHVPTLLVYRRSGVKAYLITQAIEGYVDLNEALNGTDQPLHSAIVDAVVATLLPMHAHRWYHGALHPRHVLVRVDSSGVRIALIDLEKMRRQFSGHRAAVRDLESLIRHTSELTLDDLAPHYETRFPGFTHAVGRRIAQVHKRKKYFAKAPPNL